MRLGYGIVSGKKRYGIIEKKSFFPIKGNLFGKREKTGEKYPLEEVRLLAPITPFQILCVGKNYADHAAEFHSIAPENPLLFIKSNSSLCAPSQEVILPRHVTNEVDYEAELAVVIGRDAYNIREEEAHKYILGYTCGNDVSARNCQRADGQWARAKSMDTFCPLGPWIETDLDVKDLAIEGRLNGKVMQKARTSLLIHSVPKLLAYFSAGMTLKKGTVILTGTPAGCGFAREPKVFLQDGDIYEVEIEGIGILKSRFVEKNGK